MTLPVWTPDPTDANTPPDNVPAGLAAAELRALKGRVNAALAALDTDKIANASTVAGTTATDALDNLAAALANLDTSDIENVSGLPGATTSDVLVWLAALASTSGQTEILEAYTDGALKQVDSEYLEITLATADLPAFQLADGDVLSVAMTSGGSTLWEQSLVTFSHSYVSAANTVWVCRTRQATAGSILLGDMSLALYSRANTASIGLGQYTYNKAGTAASLTDYFDKEFTNTTTRPIKIGMFAAGSRYTLSLAPFRGGELWSDGILLEVLPDVYSVNHEFGYNSTRWITVPPGSTFKLRVSPTTPSVTLLTQGFTFQEWDTQL